MFTAVTLTVDIRQYN